MTSSTQDEETVESLPAANETVVDQLLKELRSKANPGNNNRKSVRHALSMTVPVIPVNEAGDPIGPSFIVVTRDISTSGICLLHTRAVIAKHLVLAISLPGKSPVQIRVRVVRCRAIGRFYEIAAEFTSRTN